MKTVSGAACLGAHRHSLRQAITNHHSAQDNALSGWMTDILKREKLNSYSLEDVSADKGVTCVQWWLSRFW